jgi:hypothetical protein
LQRASPRWSTRSPRCARRSIVIGAPSVRVCELSVSRWGARPMRSDGACDKPARLR